MLIASKTGDKGPQVATNHGIGEELSGDLVVVLNDFVCCHLDSCIGTDFDNDNLTYLWSDTDCETSTCTLTLEVGEHNYTCTVTDPYGASASDSVSVTIYSKS